MIILVPIVVMLCGLVAYLIGGQKVAELGRIGFGVGLFFTVHMLASSSIRILAG